MGWWNDPRYRTVRNLAVGATAFGVYRATRAPGGQAARGIERVFYGNRYGDTDPKTGKYVKPGEGVSVKRTDSSRWTTYGKDPADWPKDLLDYVESDPRAPGAKGKSKDAAKPALVPIAAADVVRPKKQGGQWISVPMGDPGPWALFVNTPREAKDLIKTLARPTWQNERRAWAVKADPRNLPRVLEVADRLGVTVDPSFKQKKGKLTTEGFSGATVGDAKALQRIMRAAAKTQTAQGWKARDYQLQGIEFLARRSHLTDGRKTCAVLADDMGTGKTIQTLLALPRKARAVIVVPAVVLLNWQREAATWRPDLNITVIAGRGARLDRLPRKGGEVILLNYERMPKLAKSKATGWEIAAKDDAGKKFLAAMNRERDALPADEGRDGKQYQARLPVFLVADEAHYLKKRTSQRSQSFSSISDGVLSTWLLTGTPVENRPMDLWGLLQSAGCASEVFGWGQRGYENFKRLMGGRDQSIWNGRRYINVTVWPPDPQAGRVSPQVPELLRRVMLRRTKDQVLKELPPKTYEEIVVEPKSSREWTAARKLMDKIWAKTPPDGLPSFDQMSEVREKLARVKIPALEALIEPYEDAGKPIIVAGAHLAPLKALGKREGWDVITGEMNPKQKQRVVDAFQAGKLNGVAISSAAAGVGITLTRADTMIFADLAWKPGTNRQAEDRIHRIGQKSGNVHYRILTSSHPLDRHVNALLVAKQQVIGKAVDTLMEYTPPPKPPKSAGPLAQRQWSTIQEAIKEVKTAKARDKLARKRASLARRESIDGSIPDTFTPDQVQAMQGALAGLAGSCDFARTKDGCGFNRTDTYTGHSLAMTGLSEPLYQQVAYGILRKYRGQIGPAAFAVIYQPAGRPAQWRRSRARQFWRK
jgi:SWI/SNF-related matrix-associated actin-dependent regulator 1 of chromatin subfamily A